MRVLALDPGKATGWAEWRDGIVDSGEWDVSAAADQLLARMYGPTEVDVVVCERFLITQATTRKAHEGYWSIELIGVARWLCRRYGKPFVEQGPSEAKTFMPNERLRSLHWWSTSDHARDALRHLGLHLIRERVIAVPEL